LSELGFLGLEDYKIK